MNRLLPLAIFLSGASALIYQVTWQRILVRLVGASLPAVSLVLALFMGGLACGSFVAARTADRVKNPARIYAMLELVLAILGIGSAFLARTENIQTVLSWTGSLLAQAGDPVAVVATPPGSAVVVVVLGIICSALLLCPTMVMGASFPLASKALVAEMGAEASNKIGAVIARLYTFNLGGACLGAVAAGFGLIPHLGLSAAIFCAAASNVIASVALFTISRNLQVESSDSEESGGESRYEIGNVAVLVAGTAFVAMGLEVVWTRLFSLVLGSSNYALSAVLCTYLLGLLLGASLVPRLSRNFPELFRALALIAGVAALSIAASIHILNDLPWLLSRLQPACAHIAAGLAGYLAARVVCVSVVTFLPALLLGLIFPITINFVVSHGRATGQQTGLLYCASTLGSIAGATATGFVLIPQLVPLDRLSPVFSPISGLQSSLVLFALLLLLVCVLAAHKASSRQRQAGEKTTDWIVVPVCILAVFLTLSRPAWQRSIMSSGISFLSIPDIQSIDRATFNALAGGTSGSNILFYKEGYNTTVTVGVEPENNVVYLKNDGKVEAALPAQPFVPAPTSDLKTQVLLGQLPLLLSPTQPKRVFVVGYGTGTTCGAVLASPAVNRLVVSELEQAILDADRFFRGSNGQPFREEWRAQKRVLPVMSDARNLLALSTTPYDAIISQPAEPWINGAADLYTREFWALAKSRLTAGGVFCQWLQLYSIDRKYLALLLNTFTSVFPNCALFHAPRAGEVILIGLRADAENLLLAPPIIAHRMEGDSIRQILARVGVDSISDVMDLLLLDAAQVRQFCQSQSDGNLQNTDDNLLAEFGLPEQLLLSSDHIQNNLAALRSVIDVTTTSVSTSITTSHSPQFCEKFMLENELSQNALQKNDLHLAYESAKRAIELNPFSAKCLVQLAKVQMRQHNYNEAAQSFRRALEIDPDQFETRMSYGNCLILADHDMSGLQEIAQASHQEPESLSPHLFVTAYYTLKSQWQSARANLELLKAKAPTDPRTDLLASLIYRHYGESDLASTALKRYEQFHGRRLSGADQIFLVRQITKPPEE